jgi:hypothetical protein
VGNRQWLVLSQLNPGEASPMNEDLVVDLRGRRMETFDDFWDAVTEPCGLPDLFGRNIEAWRDTLQTRGISDVIDSHRAIIIHVDRAGLFARRDYEVRALRATFAGRQAQLVVH